MYFVWSWWYLVLLFLVAGIVAMSIVFFKMDKKDRILMKEFVEASSEKKEQKQELKSNKTKKTE